MTLPRTVADVLSEHVVFEVECIDRMYLNVYVPQLQYATGLVSYIHRQLGMPVASTAALAPVSEAFTRSVWTPTGFVDTIRSGTMVYEERTGSGTGSQEVHPGI